MAERTHDAPAGGPAWAEPLVAVPDAPRRSAAEEARTLVAQTTQASLGSLSEDGTPWASLVRFATLPDDGAPVLALSAMAEHGRNLLRDQRASLCVVDAEGDGDPLDRGRVTLAGRVEQPEGDVREAAIAAYEAQIPSARGITAFSDFTLWVLRADRVRWVGGFARMDSVTGADYAAAAPDPVGPHAAGATAHLNADHADALLLMAQALAGHPDATTAECLRADRLGLDLWVTTPRGNASARVGFATPVTEPGGLRAATVELVRRARAA